MAQPSKWAWIKAFVAGLGALIGLVVWALTGRIKERIGATKARAEDDLAEVRRMEEAGDGAGLYRDIKRRSEERP